LAGLKPKLTDAMGRNPHEDFSKDEVNSRYPNIPQDTQGYTKMEKQEGLQKVPTNPKTKRNKSLTTGRHTIGGAPPPEVISAQAQDDLEEWFLLGLTRALVVRKRRVLSR
jgi:hypothetical protein